MLVKINNRVVEFNGNTVHDLVTEKGLKENSGLAIAVNEAVIPKAEWRDYKISENDAIIIIRPAQGG